MQTIDAWTPAAAAIHLMVPAAAFCDWVKSAKLRLYRHSLALDEQTDLRPHV
jgi:hypothetical protein